MSKSFVKELVITNCLLIGGFAVIIIVGNLFYSDSGGNWINSLGLLAALVLALAIKTWRIKAKRQELDERIQIITYRAVTIGFYFMLGSIFWFFTREMIVEGQVSARTITELVAGLAGYLGGLFILYRRY
ncbi:MAG: hypothetical protein QHH02_02305 [Syntrophomonadaceae bacterium]|nr:hypothetical protein [Syntrophomonadaceae bacterium]